MSNDKGNPIRRAGSALQKFLKQQDLLEQSREGLCAMLWPEVAGKWYADHTYVTSVRGSTLYVRCESDSPRAAQLHYDAPQIIERLNEAIGEEMIDEIRTSSAGVGSSMHDVEMAEPEVPHSPDPEELDAIEIPPERLEEIRELTSDLEGEMRGRLEDVLVAQEKVNIWRSEQGYTQCPECGAWHLESDDYCFSCRPPERPTMGGGEEGLSAFFNKD